MTDLFHRSLEEGMEEFLGESGGRAIIFHLRKMDGYCGPEKFHRVIQSLFEAGAIFVEKAVARRYCENSGLVFEERASFDLVSCIRGTESVETS